MSVVSTEISHGRVQADVLAPASLAQVWESITRRDLVSMWFGDLSADVAQGKDMRLDFGDGDFFMIDTISVEPPTKIKYFWRFLGTGPRDSITWELVDHGEKCLVTVTDWEPARSQKACAELAEGWTDFLERLERYLRTGDLARYDWRRDFDGAIELPVSATDAVRLLAPAPGHFLWLPIEKALLDEPITISARQSSPAALEFQLQAENWKQPTFCRVEIVARSTAVSAIVIRHTGWAEISDDSRFCMLERRRFAEKWIASLKEAQELALKVMPAYVQ